MDLISDVLLAMGAFGVAGYCWALSRRLRGLARADAAMGPAVDALSERIDALAEAADAATARAEEVAERLSTLIQEARTREDELAFALAAAGDDLAPPRAEPSAAPPDPGAFASRRREGVAG